MNTIVIIYIVGVLLNLIFLYLMREVLITTTIFALKKDNFFTDSQKLIILSITSFLMSLLSFILLPLMLLNYLKNK